MGNALTAIVPINISETQSVTANLKWFVDPVEEKKDDHYPIAPAQYDYLINGEAAFKAVHEAIAGAQHSVDIICWGFQPSMYFVRDGKSPCIGELLQKKASEGVNVRVLGWTMEILGINLALGGGENNTPGKSDSLLWTEELGKKDSPPNGVTYEAWHAKQREFDKAWYEEATSGKTSRKGEMRFVGRGFSFLDRLEILFHTKNVSWKTNVALAGAPSHHQKMVIVDYGQDGEIGFVMGHNSLDEYWDTSDHSVAWKAPNLGRNGQGPRQDISARVKGPIVKYLHHNFAQAWKEETGEDLMADRKSKSYPEEMPDAIMAQITRTQVHHKVFSIERLYMNAVNNMTSFVYIENQYFRWPEFATKIRKAAKELNQAGYQRNIHLFVITNSTEEGMGKGVRNTYKMLETLGRADGIPAVAAQERADALPDTIKDLRARAKASTDKAEQARLNAEADRKQAELKDIRQKQGAIDQKRQQAKDENVSAGESEELNRQADEDQAKLDKEMQEKVLPEELPGLKIHVCTLVAPDSPADAWVDTYVHSKLMIVNDVFTTHGSANINNRSMRVDSELNIAHECKAKTQEMRRDLWKIHTKIKSEPAETDGHSDDPEVAFRAWKSIIDRNKENRGSEDPSKRMPYAPLIGFLHLGTKRSDLD